MASTFRFVQLSTKLNLQTEVKFGRQILTFMWYTHFMLDRQRSTGIKRKRSNCISLKKRKIAHYNKLSTRLVVEVRRRINRRIRNELYFPLPILVCLQTPLQKSLILVFRVDCFWADFHRFRRCHHQPRLSWYIFHWRRLDGRRRRRTRRDRTDEVN